MKNLIDKIKSKIFKTKTDENGEVIEPKLSKKKKIIIISVIIALVVIIIIVNTLNSRKLDVLNGKVNYSDVKRYSKTNTKRVVKDFELTDKYTVILNINKEYDIYLYVDENQYYMAYKNDPSYKIIKEDYDNIVSLLDGDNNG